MSRPLTALACCIAVLCLSGIGRADDDSPGLQLFESKVRPVLVQRCYKCHSAQSGKAESGLRVDSREAIRRGGDRGPAIVPGDPEQSLLLTAISHADPDLQMPPRAEKLPGAVINDLREWITLGAPDPREENTVARTGVDIEAGRQFWSFRKPVDTEPPAVRDEQWPRSTIDRFILATLEQNNLASSPDAEPAALLRRLHFDLGGLPPSPDDLESFRQRIAAEGIDAALAAEVDRLLDSPRFGERWGRHWLDVARFGESSGKEANVAFPHAWRYRDYVIDAVNADLPYDRFVVEQVAGDLLPYDGDAERARLLIATGFLALGPKNLDEADADQFVADVADEQIDALTRGVLANSVACARCHDHKFDPFTMEDYYALAGIFRSTKTCFGTAVTPINRVGGDPLPLPRLPEEQIFHRSIPAEQVTKLKAEFADLKAEQRAGERSVYTSAIKTLITGKPPEKEYTLRDALRIFWRMGAIEGQLEKVDEEGRAIPLAMGVVDGDRIADSPLYERGEVGKPGERVARRFPRVIELDDAGSVPTDSSGRLQFARWLTHPDQPLTARVMVNRVWKHLFGAGLVRTVDNFGTTGEPPSHPALLDHLAVQFMESDWSVKRLIREIVLSRAYRQSSTFDPAAFRQDPENRLLWRMSKRRLDAEAIRDAMLAVSGDLDPARPRGSLVARVIDDGPISLIGLNKRIPADLDGSVQRSVYLPVLRDRLPEVLDLFDFAEPSLVTGDRETTNVPLQALYLMNNPFVTERAKSLAARVQKEAKGKDERIDRAFRLCFARSPDEQELRLARSFLAQAGDGSVGIGEQWRSLCQGLLAAAEFRNID